MEVVEGFGGILTGDLTKDDFASGVGFEEIGDVVDFMVDDEPGVFFGSVLWQAISSGKTGNEGSVALLWQLPVASMLDLLPLSMNVCYGWNP